MPFGRLWLTLTVAATAVALAGCAEKRASLPGACIAPPDAFARALATAPGGVALEDGTRLSTCVRRARDDADVQTLGLTLTTLADRLARDRAGGSRSAVRLGYLVGAVRRGAGRSEGIALELARKLERAGGRASLTPAGRAAVQRGLRAGEARG